MDASAAVERAGAPSRVRAWLRALRISYWLAWQIESNWTDPFRFLVYAVARPLGGALILFFMYRVVAGPAAGGMLAFFIVGASFWPLLVGGLAGMSTAVIGDREYYRTLRYIYIAPSSWRAYLIGRSLGQATSSVGAAAVTLLFGALVLGAPMDLTAAGVAYAAAALAMGMIGVVAVALIVTTLTLASTHEAWRLPEAAAASLYLVCGVIFPVSVLPPALHAVARAIPLTWWLEAMRRAVLSDGGVVSFPERSDAYVLAMLAVLAPVWLVAGAWLFRAGERRARARGVIDRDTGF